MECSLVLFSAHHYNIVITKEVMFCASAEETAYLFVNTPLF